MRSVEYNLIKISNEGELISDSRMEYSGEPNIFGDIIVSDEHIFTICRKASELLALNKDITVDFSISLDTPNGRYLAADNNGNCYPVAQGDGNLKGG